MPSHIDHWTGATLADGRYVVQSLLGRGGMGSAFLAQDHRLNKPVVVKTPSPELMADEEFSERFAREIRSLVELDHPHIVTILDVGDHEGVPFFVMNNLGGGSLDGRRPRDDDGRLIPLAPEKLGHWLPDIAAEAAYEACREAPYGGGLLSAG